MNIACRELLRNVLTLESDYTPGARFATFLYAGGGECRSPLAVLLNRRQTMPTTMSSSKSASTRADDHLRCCDLAKIGLILAVAAGFVSQGIVWLAM